MNEILHHECGVAMIRLRKPLHYYKARYGSAMLGLDKLYQIMVKELNRGQDGAGIGCVAVSENGDAGDNFGIEKALGYGAIDELFARVRARNGDPAIPAAMRFEAQVYMGHLRYSTTGRSGLDYVHPFLRRGNTAASNLLLCGNFNMTNVDEILAQLPADTTATADSSDTVAILEQIGASLDSGMNDMGEILSQCAPHWDGGYAMCGIAGDGSMFVIRDPHGIRPVFYYIDDEIIVVASEKPVIMTAMHTSLRHDAVKELEPGCALLVGRDGTPATQRILPAAANAKCTFEHIYFSRSNDSDIYRERKLLGKALAADVLDCVGGDYANTIFSFVPDTAETAFLGLRESMEKILDEAKASQIEALDTKAENYPRRLRDILSCHLRVEKIVVKDLKKRIFITEDTLRDEVADHAFDITYGQVNTSRDTLVVLDDSIVRGTTLKRTMLHILDRLEPRRIIFVSASPQVRYPDFYGIDMSRIAELCAFNAAIALLRERGMSDVIDSVYRRCKRQSNLPREQQVNYVKEIYERFTEEEISIQIARMVKDNDIRATVQIIFLPLNALHKAMPHNGGDWYFTGNYPTPGGTALLSQSFINWYEGNPLKR